MEKFDVDQFQKLLDQSCKIGRKFVYTDVTGSTMDDSRRLAHDVKEYPHGTVVMAERQTKARGARDHKWDATNMGNIYASIILHKPPVFKTAEGRFYIEVAACLAVLQVARKFGITKAVPKWPNDLWVRGHKMAGFLVEDGRFDIPGTVNCLLILGLGVNVNADVRRSNELQGIATSMVCERGGQYINREEFLAEVFVCLEQTLANKKEDNFKTFVHENLFQENCELSVSNNSLGKVLDGKFLEICKNWDLKFTNAQTMEEMCGSSEVYTVRPKVVNKVMIVFSNVHNSSIASSLSKWLTAIIDTSKFVVCSVPESTITGTDVWMRKCSLLVLVGDINNPDLLTQKIGQYLKSGGRLMASGKGTVFLANILHVNLKEIILDLPADPVVVPLHLKTEIIPSNSNSVQSAIEECESLPYSHILPDGDTKATCNESINILASLSQIHQSQTIIFPTTSKCYYFLEHKNSSDQNDATDESPSLKHTASLACISSCGTAIKATFVSSGDQEEMIMVYTGNVNKGGRVALWGFDIVISSEYQVSAQDSVALEKDRFKRDNFLQQILEILLQS